MGRFGCGLENGPTANSESVFTMPDGLLARAAISAATQTLLTSSVHVYAAIRLTRRAHILQRESKLGIT